MHNHPAAYQPRSKLKRAFVLIGVPVLLLALAGAYAIYWRIVAQQLQAGVEYWAAEQRALGNEVAFRWDGISGFPFRFAATFREPAILWRTPRGDLGWKGATLDARMAPWNLRRIDIESKGQHAFSFHLAGDESEWRLTTTGLNAVIGFHASGAVKDTAAMLQQPVLTQPNGTVLTSVAATLALERPEVPPTDFKMELGRIRLDVHGMALPAGKRLLTEDPVDSLALDATIKGPISAAPVKDALTAWRDAGGVVELNSFAFAQGPLGLTGNATLALDPDLQPEGAGTITGTGLRDAIEILIRDGLIPPDRALAARATIKALEKPGPDGKPQVTVGLTLQHHTVSFGPVPLFVLQPIVWP